MNGILPVLSVEQIRAAEEQAFIKTAPGELMQRAAFGLAVASVNLLEETYGRIYGTTVVIVVGPGNNGGDALYAGGLLVRRGVRVSAHCVLPGVFHAEAMSAFLSAGGSVTEDLECDCDLVIDGIAGLGSERPVDMKLAQWINDQPLVVSVDIPSGVSADTGACTPELCVHADLTVTFGALKPGLVLAPGSEFAGEIEIVDIGLEFVEPAHIQVMQSEYASNFFVEPPTDSYKYSRGVVGIAAGSRHYPGAAQLCVLGAQHTGVGMVMFAEVGDFFSGVPSQHPHVVLADSTSSKITAWGVGPGFTGTDSEYEFLRDILTRPLPVVMDAGALTALAKSSELQELVRTRDSLTIVTPHAGEFRSLFPELEPPQRYGPNLKSVQQAAAQLNAMIVAKGPRTIICSSEAGCFVDIEGTSALSTAGSGDVLTGLIAGLIAAHPNRRSIEVVAAAVWTHGRAGRIAGLHSSYPTAVDIGSACVQVMCE